MDQRKHTPPAGEDPTPAGEHDEPRRDPARPGRRIVQAPGEVGGPDGPEPTRYGDWERKGRVSDF